MANVTVATPNTVGRYKHTGREPGPAPASTASGNTASVTFTVTKQAAAGATGNYGICIDRIDFSFGAAPTAPTIQISDGTVTWGPHNLAATVNQPPLVFDPPLLFNTPAAVSVTVTLTDTGPVAKTLSVRSYVDGSQIV